ncbi:hypothetical protein ACFWDI_21370 [Streptomyces sp. NPDC060064]
MDRKFTLPRSRAAALSNLALPARPEKTPDEHSGRHSLDERQQQKQR